MVSFPVQVVYALAPPAAPIIETVMIIEGTTVARALSQSAVISAIPGVDLMASRVGIWGKLVELEALVPRDARIEIYRPLIADPKESRRQRASSS